jgi:hypothetical protein
MKRSVVAPVLCTLSLGAALIAWMRWSAVDVAGARGRDGVPPLRALVAAITDDALAGVEEAIVTNDPFRLSNSPSAVRYDPAEGVTPSGVAMSPQPRPTLVLKAIVGGPPWQAIIDGIPGQPSGTLAQTGSKFDRLTVRSITRDSVIVVGTDTAWVLSFRAR